MIDQVEVGELLRAQEEAHPGGAPAAEQARDAVGGDGTELVDQDQGGQRLVLVVGGDGQ